MGDREFGIVIETVSFNVSTTIIRGSASSYGCFYDSLLEELMDRTLIVIW